MKIKLRIIISVHFLGEWYDGCDGDDGHCRSLVLSGHLAATPSCPPSDVGLTLLPHPLLLSHGNPPPSCTLLGPLPQVPHPVQQTGSLSPDEEAGQEPPVLNQIYESIHSGVLYLQQNQT
jgi:hypothetical protein